MSTEAKILVVDDDPISLRVLRRALETAGVYEVRTASDATQGMTQALEFRPDLILSDRVMPGTDGIEFCRRAKAHPTLSESLFVIISAVAEAEGNAAGLGSGADDYLIKPIPAEELKARVRDVLRRRPSAEASPAAAAVVSVPNTELVELLVHVADLAVPGAANRVFQMAAAAEWMAEDIHMDPQQAAHLDLAVHVHELGKIALPAKLLKVRPSQLSRNDWEAYRGFAAVTQVLLRHVPSIESANQVVRHMFENWDASGVPDHLLHGRIPVGSRILRVLTDFFEDLDRVRDSDLRQRHLKALQEHAGQYYDPAVLQALVDYVDHDLDKSLVAQRRYVRIDELQPGFRLADDLTTSAGAVLLRANEVLGEEEIRRLVKHHATDPFLFSIGVFPPERP